MQVVERVVTILDVSLNEDDIRQSLTNFVWESKGINVNPADWDFQEENGKDCFPYLASYSKEDVGCTETPDTRTSMKRYADEHPDEQLGYDG